MKIFADVEKKTLKVLENERSIFRGEYSADKLELYINKTLENEYPTITGLLSNGRKIGPYTVDEGYVIETIDGVNYTKGDFTLSKENGFNLTEGKMQITIWLNNTNGTKQALGNLTLNVINTTAFNGGDIIVSGDLEETIVNYRVELENLQSNVNGASVGLANLAHKVKNVTDLGEIGGSVYEIENAELNAITTAGLYTFKNNKNQSLMIVNDLSIASTGYKQIMQLILYPTLDNTIRTIQRKFSGISPVWEVSYIDDVALKSFVNQSVTELEEAVKKYVEDNYVDLNSYQQITGRKQFEAGADFKGQVDVYGNTTYYKAPQLHSSTNAVNDNDLVNKKYVDTKIGELFGEGQVDATLDTIAEIAKAIEENEDVVEAINKAIGEKVGKDEIMDVVLENTEEVKSLEIITSNKYNEPSDKEVPTTKAVAKIVNETAKPLAIETTYAELKALRDSGKLVAGQTYIITDYQCTTTTFSTTSANHQFDVIVVADSENTLNENARARLHEGDTYFANSNLEAWELKYCIDNDTTRFGWADEVNGKGVIYYMKDEWNNEVPYDFKNIQFYNEENDEYFYTFSYWYNESDGRIIDTSIFGNDGTLINDEDTISGVRGNVIKENYKSEYDNIELKIKLNNIIFVSTEEYDMCYYGCYNNTFGYNCFNNTFGGFCYSNTFGEGCANNTFGDECYGNTFGNECYNNTFGYNCSYNTFRGFCKNNTFGEGCANNTFGEGCANNTFGEGCANNTFGGLCYSITFGEGCANNTFGDECYGNTFGNECYKINLIYISWTKFNNEIFQNNLYQINVTRTAQENERIAYWYGETDSVYYYVTRDNGTTWLEV